MFQTSNFAKSVGLRTKIIAKVLHCIEHFVKRWLKMWARFCSFKNNFDNSRSKNSRVILSWASRRRDDSGTELFLNSCARGLTSQRWTISITTLVILCFSVLKTAHIIVVQYNVLCILTDLVHVCTVDAKYNMYMYNNNDYIHVFIERYNFRIPHSHYTHSSTILS